MYAAPPPARRPAAAMLVAEACRLLCQACACALAPWQTLSVYRQRRTLQQQQQRTARRGNGSPVGRQAAANSSGHGARLAACVRLPQRRTRSSCGTRYVRREPSGSGCAAHDKQPAGSASGNSTLRVPSSSARCRLLAPGGVHASDATRRSAPSEGRTSCSAGAAVKSLTSLSAAEPTSPRRTVPRHVRALHPHP